MQELSSGEQRVNVQGNNIRQVIDNLDAVYPGFKDRLVEDGRVKPNISVAIDGEITPLGMLEKVREDSETVPSETLSLLMGMLTLAVGSLSSTNVKDAVPPASVVLSLITLTVIPGTVELSSMKFVLYIK